jgi:hypothetical protein
MIDRAMADALEQYRAGLEAEIAVLRQLDQVAARQRGVTEDRDFEALASAGDERERLTRTLVTLEQGLKDVRGLLHRHQDKVVRLPEYQHVLTLRQSAATLVSRILATDEESMQALADAELARRAAVASLENGEATLAAYRRVLTPSVTHAALVDRRG